jgi:hypothetical protein
MSTVVLCVAMHLPHVYDVLICRRYADDVKANAKSLSNRDPIASDVVYRSVSPLE